MKKIISLIKLAKIINYDFARFRRFSSAFNTTAVGLLTGISTKYHIIEKGLSMPVMKPFFGRERLSELMGLMRLYREKGFDCSVSQYVSALLVIADYIDAHKRLYAPEVLKNHKDGVQLLITLDQFLVAFSDVKKKEPDIKGGTKNVNRNTFIQESIGNFEQLCHARSTVRDFTDKAVDKEIIIDAISLAQRCPSTCNRQTTRLCVLRNKETIDKILTLHKGTRGFNDNILTLIIVSGDLRASLGIRDYYQVFLDSGLFAMNLLYSLQYKGLGACILHWAVDEKKDAKARKILNIDEAHTITCLIGVGHVPEDFKVANSERLSLNEMTVFKDD